MQLQWHNFEAKHAPSSSVMFKWLKYKTLWLLQSCQISLQSLCSSLFKIRITTHCVESPSIIVQVEIRNSKRKLVKQIPAETNICFSSFVRSHNWCNMILTCVKLVAEYFLCGRNRCSESKNWTRVKWKFFSSSHKNFSFHCKWLPLRLFRRPWMSRHTFQRQTPWLTEYMVEKNFLKSSSRLSELPICLSTS